MSGCVVRVTRSSTGRGGAKKRPRGVRPRFRSLAEGEQTSRRPRTSAPGTDAVSRETGAVHGTTPTEVVYHADRQVLIVA